MFLQVSCCVLCLCTVCCFDWQCYAKYKPRQVAVTISSGDSQATPKTNIALVYRIAILTLGDMCAVPWAVKSRTHAIQIMFHNLQRMKLDAFQGDKSTGFGVLALLHLDLWETLFGFPLQEKFYWQPTKIDLLNMVETCVSCSWSTWRKGMHSYTWWKTRRSFGTTTINSCWPQQDECSMFSKMVIFILHELQTVDEMESHGISLISLL